MTLRAVYLELINRKMFSDAISILASKNIDVPEEMEVLTRFDHREDDRLFFMLEGHADHPAILGDRNDYTQFLNDCYTDHLCVDYDS